MTIRLDATRETVLVICSACGWRDLELNRHDAWTEGLKHERATHPEDGRAIHAAESALSRN